MIELLIAMAILLTVSASTALIFKGITRAWSSGQVRTERYQQARLLFDLFERELSSSVVSLRFPLIGIKEGQESPMHAKAALADELMFVGTLPGRRGLVERGYWVNGEERLMCHDEEPADGDYSTGVNDLCGTDVQGFEVSYFDADSGVWIDQWDGQTGASQAGRLPKAVRIALTIGKQKPERFETVIYVPTS